MDKNLTPAIWSFLLATALLLNPALTLWQHGDEAQYIWTSAYFGGKLTRLDFRANRDEKFLDPGWSPGSFWALCCPLGTRYLYSAALGATGSEVPARPFRWDDLAQQGPEHLAPARTLLVARGVAVLCAALGLALIALRLGWRGFAAGALLLAIPHARDDLARAWAEGPLLLALGLCAVAARTPWFGPAAGLAAAFKLTALPLWLAAFWLGPIGHSRLRSNLGVWAAAATWVLLHPPAWFNRGPYHLLVMIEYRRRENASQAAAFDEVLFGQIWMPTRYYLPLELLGALLIVFGLSRFWAWLRARAPSDTVSGKHPGESSAPLLGT